MNRLLLLISIVGAAAYMGYIKVPVTANSTGNSSGGGSPLSGTLAQRVFQSFGTSFTGVADKLSSASSASSDTRHSLGTLSQGVLQPLDSQPFMTTQDARQTLINIQSSVAARPSDPDYRRNVQAVNLLAQAIDERSGCIDRLMQGTTTNALDKVPGRWHVVGHPETAINPTEMSRQLRGSFWAQATLRQWQTRCDYYRAEVGALLAPRAPAR